MRSVRTPAVAGMFYPARAGDLAAAVERLLADAALRAETGPMPKAIIAPHAGYIYSGAIAASAYARVRPQAERIRRVVLIGPAHRVALRGLAVPGAEAFATPLGQVPLDHAAIEALLRLPQVQIHEAAHAPEHALEVQLPFLQEVLSRFSLVPIVVGHATADEVAEVLDQLWGGDETLIVVSSDLSHYLPYTRAQAIDARTCRAIETLDDAAIADDQACGRLPVQGLLRIARERQLIATTLDLRNSGDTAGDRSRVVGYGAWMFAATAATAGRRTGEGMEAAAAAADHCRRLLGDHGETLLHVAAASIHHGLVAGAPLPISTTEHATALQQEGASFVTLYHLGELRGCVGSSRAHRPLVADVAANAFAAAFRDSRFSALKRTEVDELSLSVTLLSDPVAMTFDDEADLLAQLRPGKDGLIIESDGKRALFLPQVWSSLPQPTRFLGQLKQKAGLRADHWRSDFTAERFEAVSISSAALAEPASLWR